VPGRELPLGPGCPQSRLGCLGTLAKAAHDGQPARARGPIEDVGALARVRTNRGAAVRSRSAAPSPTLRPHRSGCSWSAALQGKRVPLTARPALQVFSAPSVSPCGGHRYTRAAGLAAAAREASPRGGHVFRGDRAVLGGDPENALQPRHARPLQEFLRNTPDRRSSSPPSPSAGEIRWQKLAAAQGFPSGYRFAGNQGDKVKQIGNAVPLDVAKALVLARLGAA